MLGTGSITSPRWSTVVSQALDTVLQTGLETGYHVCPGYIQKTGLETCTSLAVLRSGLGASLELKRSLSSRRGSFLPVWELPGEDGSSQGLCMPPRRL